MECNIKVVRHQSVVGTACVCPTCGEPYPIWPTHLHTCASHRCPTYRAELWPHWHVNPEVRLCHGECQPGIVN